MENSLCDPAQKRQADVVGQRRDQQFNRVFRNSFDRLADQALFVDHHRHVQRGAVLAAVQILEHVRRRRRFAQRQRSECPTRFRVNRNSFRSRKSELGTGWREIYSLASDRALEFLNLGLQIKITERSEASRQNVSNFNYCREASLRAFFEFSK